MASRGEYGNELVGRGGHRGYRGGRRGRGRRRGGHRFFGGGGWGWGGPWGWDGGAWPYYGWDYGYPHTTVLPDYLGDGRRVHYLMGEPVACVGFDAYGSPCFVPIDET